MPDIQTSNHAKYVDAATDPVVGTLMNRLFEAVTRKVRMFAGDSLLDAGCGEGHAIERLGGALPSRYAGVDTNPSCIGWCRERHPGLSFSVASVRRLPFAGRSFDIVLCMEVLEHLGDPAPAVRELARVARRGVVLTVPFEPVFQLGNAARGKYLRTLGNHPEHVQHWGRRSFPRFLAATGALDDVTVEVAGPWLVATARPAR